QQSHSCNFGRWLGDVVSKSRERRHFGHPRRYASSRHLDRTFMNPALLPSPYQSTPTVPLRTQQLMVPPQPQPWTVSPQFQQSASLSNFLGLSVPGPASTPTSASTPTPTTIVISDDNDGNNNVFTTHNSGRRGRTRDQSSRSRSRGSSPNTKPRRSQCRARSVDQASQGRNRRQQTTYTVFAGIPDDVRNVDLLERVSIKTYWFVK